ncbi:MAG: hypothetical protein OXG36_16440, partial [Caldilineaceae bacterium]|nr:hypothetical protein [Caldilineaceae bacterium]
MTIQVPPAADENVETFYAASQWQLMWSAFKKHRMAMVGSFVLLFIYLVTVAFSDLLSPYSIEGVHADYPYAPPQLIRFIDAEGRFHLRPFVYGWLVEEDPVTWEDIFVKDTESLYPIKLGVRGEQVKIWGTFKTDWHLFGVEEPGVMFLFGTDQLGRDLFTR